MFDGLNINQLDRLSSAFDGCDAATSPRLPSVFGTDDGHAAIDPERHPWLLAFERSPEVTFGDLLSGYAQIAPYDRLDAPDAAKVLFGRLAHDDPARMSLAPAIIGWLNKRRREAAPAPYPQRQRWIREIREAFDIIALLEVTEAAVELRRSFVNWNAFVANLVLSPSRDAQAGYWWMLALTQPVLRQLGSTQADPGIDPFSLVPHWLWICENAGGKLPEHYLGIGLMGLRRLPDIEPGAEVPWLMGLARWALAHEPTEAAFKAEWLALKSLYPRTPARWRDLVSYVLSDSRFRTKGIVAPAWWAADNDFR